MNDNNVEGVDTLNDSVNNDTSKINTKIKKQKNPKKIRKNLKSELFMIFCIGQACLLLILIGAMVLINLNSKPLDIPLSDWKSSYIKFKDGAWYADSSTVSTDEEINLLYGPKITIGEGSYTVTVDYDCSRQQTCYAISNSFVKSSRGRMIPNANSVSFRVDVNQSVKDFEVVVRYNGNGSIKINNISIREDHARVGRFLIYALMIFAACDIWYFFEDKIKKNKTVIITLACIVLFSSLPLFTGGIGRGHDISYHLIRIEALADSLKHGVFPNRVSDLWFDGYGYPSSIYYGDILLYIPAVLRLLGFTVVRAYKIYILLINIGTAAFGYLCFKGIFKNKYSALMATLVYSTATYRFVNIYIRSAVGEYTAMMFLPIVAYGIYKIYNGDMTKPKEYFKAATVLALSMTGLVGCHILTTEMVFLMLVLVCLVCIKKTIKPETIRALGIAVGETVLMSAYFIVPFLDYYKNVQVRINGLVDENTPFIQGQGCSIAEYFSVFRDVFTVYSVHQNRRLACTPGFILMAALLVGAAAIAYTKKSKKRKELVFYVAFSVLSLYLASDIFPWDRLAARTDVGRLVAQVQFPWRYVSIAIVFMTMIFAWLFCRFTEKNFGKLTRQIRVGAMGVVLVVSFFVSTIFTGMYIDDIPLKRWLDIGELDPWAVCAGEYLLDDFDSTLLKGRVRTDNVSAEIVEKNGTKMVVYCECDDDKDGSVEVPIFNYKGYVVSDESGNTYEITNGRNSTIKFNLSKSFKGNITVDFVVPWYWRLSEIVSLLTVIGICGFFVVDVKGKISRKKK